LGRNQILIQSSLSYLVCFFPIENLRAHNLTGILEHRGFDGTQFNREYYV
jgi:hypothetical protein